jgi:hypothetical protein
MIERATSRPGARLRCADAFARALAPALGAAAILGAFTGCRSPKSSPTVTERTPEVDHGPLPDLASVVVRHNERVRDLAKFQSPVNLVLETPEPSQGAKPSARRTDRAEGFLQWIQPDRVAMRLDKVGQNFAWLGVGGGKYWWIGTRDTPEALVGSMDRANPDKARELGLPVHPLDLPEVLGAVPLPDSPGSVHLAWSSEGLLRITSAARWGVRVLWLDRDTLDPKRVALLDARGRSVVLARVERIQRVEVLGDTFSPARLGTRYHIDLPLADARVTLDLVKPQNPGDAMKTRAFELDALLRAYRVDRVRDLDASAETPP